MRNDTYCSSHRVLYEIKAANGQILEHGFTSQKKCLARIKEYKKTYTGEHFTMCGYDKGKYGNE